MKSLINITKEFTQMLVYIILFMVPISLLLGCCSLHASENSVQQGIIMCMVSQGNKGVYPTLMKIHKETEKHYFVTSAGGLLVERPQSSDFQAVTLFAIDKGLCRVLTQYEKGK